MTLNIYVNKIATNYFSIKSILNKYEK